MNFTEIIADQAAAMKRPLVAVTVAAVPRPDTPVILTLHWHGFVRERLAPVPQASTVRYTSYPSTALQVNARWRDALSLDLAAMDAGWQFGAWDIARFERPSCMRLGADSNEARDCLRAFGAYREPIEGADIAVRETPDADELIVLAGRSGYLVWLFRPVRGGIWAEVADDATLDEDGARKPPCPLLPDPPRLAGHRRTVYRFGSPARLPVD